MRKLLIHFVVVMMAPPCGAESIGLVNRNFAVENGKLVFKGAARDRGSYRVAPNVESYRSSKSPRSNGFHLVELQTKDSRPTRAFDFNERQSGLHAGTVKFNEKGQPVAFTQCDIWIGCVTVTKRLCSSLVDSSNGAKAAKIEECVDALKSMLFPLASEKLQTTAAGEYAALVDYRKRNGLMGASEDTWDNWIQHYTTTDKGKLHTQALKQNLTKELGDRPWSYRNAIEGLGRAFQLCQDQGASLASTDDETSDQGKPKGVGAGR